MMITGEEEFLIPSGMFDIDNEFTTSNTTDEEGKDEKSNNYSDNINDEIFRNEESTIVFEDKSLAPTTIRTDKPNNIIIKDLFTVERFDMVVGLLNEDMLDFVFGIISDNPLDEHTREMVCGVLQAWCYKVFYGTFI